MGENTGDVSRDQKLGRRAALRGRPGVGVAQPQNLTHNGRASGFSAHLQLTAAGHWLPALCLPASVFPVIARCLQVGLLLRNGPT